MLWRIRDLHTDPVRKSCIRKGFKSINELVFYNIFL